MKHKHRHRHGYRNIIMLQDGSIAWYVLVIAVVIVTFLIVKLVTWVINATNG